MSNHKTFLDQLLEIGCDVRAAAWERNDGTLGIDGPTADDAGAAGIQSLANERGLPVKVFGKSKYHSGKTFRPEDTQ